MSASEEFAVALVAASQRSRSRRFGEKKARRSRVRPLSQPSRADNKTYGFVEVRLVATNQRLAINELHKQTGITLGRNDLIAAALHRKLP